MAIKRTLYWFRFDTDTGNISVIPVDDYSDIVDGRRSRYRFTRNGSTYCAYKDKLDMVKNWSIYSFDSDESKAAEIFRDFVLDRFNKADLESKRYSKMLFKLMANNGSRV